MTTSPEKCLGGLLKDIDKELSPRELDFESKDETTYKTSVEQKLSLDSIFSLTSKSKSSLLFSFSEDNIFSSANKYLTSFNKSTILSAFHSQRNTIILQKSLSEINKDTINFIVQELSGTFSKIIKNKNGNYFCTDLFKLCDKEQRILILKVMKCDGSVIKLKSNKKLKNFLLLLKMIYQMCSISFEHESIRH